MSNFEEKLMLQIREEIEKQTKSMTEALMKTILVAMEEKIKPLEEDNKKLKSRMDEIENKMERFEKKAKENNLILFGMREHEELENLNKLQAELVEIFKSDLSLSIEVQDINRIVRIGEKKEGKSRPIVIKFNRHSARNSILKNKKKCREGMYITEDYPKSVLEKRKILQEKVQNEYKKGNYAFIRYDKLVVRGPRHETSKKRPLEVSPETSRKENEATGSTKITKTNAFSIMRAAAYQESYNRSPN